jgi:Na+/melibiose symporter-like transporter
LKRLSYGRLWSHRDFNRLWLSDTVSQIGNQFTSLALPILAVLTLHAGAFEIGLLMAIQTVSFPVLGLFVGVWADRLKKRPIMIVCNFGRMASLASIPLVFFLSALTLYQLYAVAAINGIFTVFFDISYQSYLPVLIDREDLVEGNSKLQSSASGAQVVGPAVAGVVYQLVGGAVAIAVDAVGYVISALSLVSIRKREAVPESHSPTGHPNFLAEMKEGIHVVFDNPILWRITACTATSNLGSAIAGAVFVIFLLSTLSFSPALIGILGTVGAVGFLLGTVVTPAFTKRLGLGRAIAISAGIVVINMATPLAIYGHAFLIVAAIGLTVDFMLPVYNINQVSLRQTIVRDRFQGRMNATVRTINWGTLPVGAIIGGALGSTVGLIGTILIGGALQGAAVLWIMSKHVIRLREITNLDQTEHMKNM